MLRLAQLPAALLAVAWLGVALAQPAPAPPASSPGPTPPGAAGAADESSASAAQRRYEEAQEHFKARRYTEALRLFQQLYAEHRSPNARLYVARCLREMGRLPEAYDEMDRTRREAADRAAAEPRFADTRDVAQVELAEIRAVIVLLDIRPSAWPEGLRVEVNGRPVPVHRLGAPVPVMPGRARIYASAPGFVDVREERVVQAQATEVVPLQLTPVPPPAPAKPAAPVVPDGGEEPAGADDSSGYVMAGITFVGVGVVGWITFAVAAVMAEDRFDEIERKCGGVRCTDPSINDSIDEGRVMDIVANAGLGVGVLSFVTAGVLFGIAIASSDEEPEPKPAAANVEPRAWSSPAGSFVGLGGTF